MSNFEQHNYAPEGDRQPVEKNDSHLMTDIFSAPEKQLYGNQFTDSRAENPGQSAFDQTAKTHNLSPQERALGQGLLDNLRSGSFEDLQRKMEKMDPNSITTQRAMLAVDSALSSQGMQVTYNSSNMGIDGDPPKPVGQLRINTPEGTLIVGTDKRVSGAEDKNFDASGYGKPVPPKQIFSSVQDKLFPQPSSDSIWN